MSRPDGGFISAGVSASWTSAPGVWSMRDVAPPVKSVVWPASYLLASFPSAAAAYSVRRLSKSYTGYCMRIRRTSDNSTIDIGFLGDGTLDTSAITTFIGASSATVTTWYDQSGNGNNATQTTAANQPHIVNSGSIITTNSKPSIDFTLNSGAPTCLDASISSTNTNWAAFGVAMMKSYVNPILRWQYGRWISIGKSENQDYNNTSSTLGFITPQWASWNALTPAGISGSTGTPILSAVGYNAGFRGVFMQYNIPGILSIGKSGSSVTVGFNTLISDTLTQAGTLNGNTLRIGANVNWTEANSNLYGTISEVIYYQSDKSSSRNNIINAINSYYKCF